MFKVYELCAVHIQCRIEHLQDEILQDKEIDIAKVIEQDLRILAG